MESLVLRHAAEDFYGEVLSANVTIKGQLLKCDHGDLTHYLERPVYSYDITTVYDTGKLVLTSIGEGGRPIDCWARFSLDSNVFSNQVTLYLLPIFEHVKSNMRGLVLLRNGKARYERCGVFEISTDHQMINGRWKRQEERKDKLLDQEFWKDMESRTKEREEARRSAGLETFEVTYLVGPPQQKEENMPMVKDEDGSEEYESFDGKDYVFSII